MSTTKVMQMMIKKLINEDPRFVETITLEHYQTSVIFSANKNKK